MPGSQQNQHVPSDENMVGRSLREGEYRIERVIDYAGKGQLYLASHVALTLPLALKRMRVDQPLPHTVVAELDYLLHASDTAYHYFMGRMQPELPSSGGASTDRFLREALLLARLRHPAIPMLYDYFLEDDYWYLVMDYIPGPSLHAYLRQCAPLLPLEALNYAMQVCDILDYLHKQWPPVIFLDLQPLNLVLAPNGSVMLVNFEHARYFVGGQEESEAEQAISAYRAPEQARQVGQIDGRADLFSLGRMLYEMVTAIGPQSDETLHVSDWQQRFPNVSAILGGLVTLAVQANPAERFQVAHTFYQALERVYLFEERRVYCQVALKAQQEERKKALQDTLPQDALPDPLPPSPSVQRKDALVPLLPLSLEQRRQARQTLQQTRQERLAQEHLEMQLASFDESLKRRSLVNERQSSSRYEKEAAESTWRVRFMATLSRLLRSYFTLALVVCLVKSFLYV